MNLASKYKEWTTGNQQTLHFLLKTTEITSSHWSTRHLSGFFCLNVALMQSLKEGLGCLFSHISFFNTIETFSSLLSSFFFYFISL